MVMFNSYVKLPEGRCQASFLKQKNDGTFSKWDPREMILTVIDVMRNNDKGEIFQLVGS